MASSIFTYSLLFAVLFGLSLARTDLSGCVSSTAISPAGTSLIWYVPDTGETCEFLDCGGGRAPPKTTVPGCAAYSGTATYSPSYLAGYGPASSFSSAAIASTTSGPANSVNSMAVTSMSSSQTSISEASSFVSSSAADTSSIPMASSDFYYFLSSSTSVTQSTTSAASSTTKSSTSTAGSSSSSSTPTSATNVANGGTLVKISSGSLGVVGLIAAILG